MEHLPSLFLTQLLASMHKVIFCVFGSKIFFRIENRLIIFVSSFRFLLFSHEEIKHKDTLCLWAGCKPIKYNVSITYDI